MRLKLKTYRAYTMAEALAAVKRDLGPDAVILNTRSVRQGGVLGLGRRSVVEVTATRGEQSGVPARKTPRPSTPRPARGRERAIELAYALARARQEVAAGAAPPESAPETDPRPRPRSAAAKVIPVAPPPPAPMETDVDPVAPPADARPRRFVLKPAERAERARTEAVRATPLAPPPAFDPSSMQEELTAIREMVGRVLRQGPTPGAAGRSAAPDLPEELFEMYLKLVAQDLSEELADDVVRAVRRELDGDQLADAGLVQETMMRLLRDHIPVSAEPVLSRGPDARPLTLALVGPTGVGKTTTLAKLAAAFKLRHRRRVGLITADTYRIAAVDQLRTYANIIGLPLKVVLTPAEMRQAVQSLRDCDAILIDTAGRSQNDGARIDELKEFLAAADPHETHLVLSSTAGEKVLLREAEAFGAVGVDKVVLTKLDEAVSFGMLINVVRQVGKQLSFVTTGQEVPDHIEAASADRLADLVLGGAVHP